MKGKQPSLNQSGLTSTSLLMSRRRFVQGLAGSGILSTGLASSRAVYGASATSGMHKPQELRGKTFNLTIEETMVNFTGSTQRATAINGSIPGPTLRWKEGD